MPKKTASPAYELVAIDVDGTLLDSNHELSEGAIEAVHAIRSAGMNPILVTGRSTLSITHLYDVLDLSPYYITSGGAFVGHIAGDVILDAPIGEQDAVALAGLVRERGMGLCFHRPDKLYCELDDRMMATVHGIVGEERAEQVDDVLQETIVPAKVTVFGERTKLTALNEDILAQELYVRTAFSGALFLEVTRGDVSKGTALTVLSEHLEIPLARTAVIGDQENDLSMIEVAGLTVAMGNAPEIVKNKAQHVAPENDEGGAAWALMNIILPGRSA